MITITKAKKARIEMQVNSVQDWQGIAQRAYEYRMENVKRANGYVQITVPDIAHKLAGLLAINTSITNNPCCIARRNKALKCNDCGHVCLGCYASNLMYGWMYKPAEQLCLYNQYLLTSHLLSEDEIKHIDLIPNKTVRFEMFGDTSNTVQAENYVRIPYYWSSCNFGVWSKNLGHYKTAFSKYGKPGNMTFVKSSEHLNIVDDVKEDEKFVDVVFTVCDDINKYNELIKLYNGVPCAGVSCVGCMACYNYRRENGKVLYVFELLRK